MITAKILDISQKNNLYKPKENTREMNKWSELLFGLVLIIAPIYIAFYSQNWGIWNFWDAAGTFLKGGIFWFLVMIGVVFILLGIADLKESVNSPAHRPAQHTSKEKTEV